MIDYGIVYLGIFEFNLIVYVFCDVDWVGDLEIWRLIMGNCILFLICVVSWKSRK